MPSPTSLPLPDTCITGASMDSPNEPGVDKGRFLADVAETDEGRYGGLQHSRNQPCKMAWDSVTLCTEELKLASPTSVRSATSADKKQDADMHLTPPRQQRPTIASIGFRHAAAACPNEPASGASLGLQTDLHPSFPLPGLDVLSQAAGIQRPFRGGSGDVLLGPGAAEKTARPRVTWGDEQRLRYDLSFDGPLQDTGDQCFYPPLAGQGSPTGRRAVATRVPRLVTPPESHQRRSVGLCLDSAQRRVLEISGLEHRLGGSRAGITRILGMNPATCIIGARSEHPDLFSSAGSEANEANKPQAWPAPPIDISEVASARAASTTATSRRGKRKSTPRRKCTVDDCPNRVVQGGLCIAHGAKRKKCKHPGCTKHVKKAGLCSGHGPARKRCSVAGCFKVSVQSGRCNQHGANRKSCCVTGCTEESVLKGVCQHHLDRIRSATQEQQIAEPSEEILGEDNIQTDLAESDDPAHSRGLSIFHEVSADTLRYLLNESAV